MRVNQPPGLIGSLPKRLPEQRTQASLPSSTMDYANIPRNGLLYEDFTADRRRQRRMGRRFTTVTAFLAGSKK
ncbi:hypothetical protein ACLOJK_004741 [Asimina triloba]